MTTNGNTDRIQRFELNGREYILHKMPATKAIVLLSRLTRQFGDAFVQLMLVAASSDRKRDKDAPVTENELRSLATNLSVFERLDDDSILNLERLVFPFVWVGNARIYNGNDTELDLKFEGYELDSLRVLWEAIRFNLGPFIPAILSRLPVDQIATATA
jgi:hypothetical protein